MAEFTQEVFTSIPGNIKNVHPEIVLDVTEDHTSAFNPKFTIKMNGWDSYLKCEEYGDKQGNLQAFFYNWYNKDHSLIMKFHNHNHEKYPDTPDAITEFDPVHLQFPLLVGTDYEGKIRDHSIYQSLDDVLNFLRHLQWIEERKI
ncbi:hypothetical protein A8L34_29635 [Bacillus sp. FJAT-27264]|uniref:hypothetical protein n=1 Tax=Paenibacillus sp. (strain DSM 101736 / FJAT-27264) TaxID=1850362 RepID=UPI000807D08B|nr:hypothetical protein [Bacillus sp. FJAT-27264]OBZ12911.1 hypothetical protein A8L34_29635 [Bacillus sp. FJAT-27264]